ncbi:MAG: hypothetical protein ACYTFQ_26205, partial [Planctomycetota bacterium]
AITGYYRATLRLWAGREALNSSRRLSRQAFRRKNASMSAFFVDLGGLSCDNIVLDKLCRVIFLYF